MEIRAVVLGSSQLSEEVSIELVTGLKHLVPVYCADTVEELLGWLDDNPDVVVPVMVVTPLVGETDSALIRARSHEVLRYTPTLLVTDRLVLDDIAKAVDGGFIEAIITEPWRAGVLGFQACKLAIKYLQEFYPVAEETAAFLDCYGGAITDRFSRLLRMQAMEETQMVRLMLAGIERVLGPRPRVVLPPGTRLTRQGEITDAIFICTRGKVALERDTPLGTIVMHHASTGPLVGLLSFAQQRIAFFTSRTSSEVEGIFLSVEQLDWVLSEEPLVSAALASLVIRSLDRRLRRSEQIQMEKTALNADLDAERVALQKALEELKFAREELVSRERFATLGELSAGVAHELNNPVAALQRSCEHLQEDIDRLVGSHPRAEFVREAFWSARNRGVLSTREERQIRREFYGFLGDQELAYRLVSAGVTDLDQVVDVAKLGREALELMEVSAGIGAALRNLDMASSRVRRLVLSLKAYARPDELPVDGVDVNQSIDDTLHLTHHRLRGIEVETHFGDLSPVRCHPGQLDQVWTNILVNSADALAGQGKICVVTDMPDSDRVRVRISDNGKQGIAPEVLPRIFEPRFTTKHGRVSFGLGMGLSMVKAIVERHGGTISMSSRPGFTETTVFLQVTGPTLKEAEE